MGLRRRAATLAAWTVRWLAVCLLWLAAVLACVVDVDAAFDLGLTPAIHSLFTAAAIIAVLTAVFWTGLRTGRGRGLKPGERIVSDDEYHASEMALTRAIMAGWPEPGDGDRQHLRSVI